MTLTWASLIGLLATVWSLLASVVVLIWKSSASTTRMIDALAGLRQKDAELEARLCHLDRLPLIEKRIEFVEQHHSQIPKMMSRLDVIEARLQHSRELREVYIASARRSRPEEDT